MTLCHISRIQACATLAISLLFAASGGNAEVCDTAGRPFDVRTADFSALVQPGDVVFHLAAYVHRLPRTADEVREVHEVNHAATVRLAAACASAGATAAPAFIITV